MHNSLLISFSPAHHLSPEHCHNLYYNQQRTCCQCMAKQCHHIPVNFLVGVRQWPEYFSSNQYLKWTLKSEVQQSTKQRIAWYRNAQYNNVNLFRIVVIIILVMVVRGENEEQ